MNMSANVRTFCEPKIIRKTMAIMPEREREEFHHIQRDTIIIIIKYCILSKQH
jgi:hypothetical protein